MMDLVKKISSLTKEQQIDVVRLKVLIARRAYEQSEGDTDEVRAVLASYLSQCEKLMEKVNWS